MTATNPDAKKRPAAKQDFEALTTILSVSAVLAIVALITTLPEMRGAKPVRPAVQGYSIPAHLRQPPPALGKNPHQAPPAVASLPPAVPEKAPDRPMSEFERRVTERFQQAVAMLHAKQYDYAIIALDSVLEMVPDMPEAYVNMGYAFIGLEEYGPATKAFEKAIDLRVNQYNAYYGLAMAWEGLGQYEAALGAMRSYIHLAPPNDPYVTKARAALWEWEAQLGRVPGVRVAPEGVEPDSIKTPKWSQGH